MLLSKNQSMYPVLSVLETGDFIKEIPNKKEKGMSVIIWILVSIFLIILLTIGAIIVVPMFNKVPNVEVPDVSGLTVIEAEDVLLQKGFTVNTEIQKESSDTYDAGIVIRTEPRSGRQVKKGKEITIYESTGTEIFVLEDYVGQNYIKVQTLLELHGLVVKVETKEVEITESTKEDIIIEQSLDEGTEVKAGDEITLYVPEIVKEYPDFVSEDWIVSDIEDFCNKNGIKLQVEYIETNEYAPGKVFYQSRTGKVTEGATLKIKVAKEVSLPPEILPEEDNNGEEDNSENSEEN